MLPPRFRSTTCAPSWRRSTRPKARTRRRRYSRPSSGGGGKLTPDCITPSRRRGHDDGHLLCHHETPAARIGSGQTGLWMKETALAKHYIEVLNISKESTDAQKLLHYRAPQIAKEPHRCSSEPVPGRPSQWQHQQGQDWHEEGPPAPPEEHQCSGAEVAHQDHTEGPQDRKNHTVCTDLHDRSVHLNESIITYFSAFRPMLGERATMDQSSGSAQNNRMLGVMSLWDSVTFAIPMPPVHTRFLYAEDVLQCSTETIPVRDLQDGRSPLGLVGGVATIGVLHFQQLSKGVRRCIKVSRGAQSTYLQESLSSKCRVPQLIIDGETIAPILTDKAVTFITCSITFTRCATSPATSICTSAKKGRDSKVIICYLCSKPFDDPRILSCLHSFCLQCLHHEIEKSGSQQMCQCPICEQNTCIPVGGASVLPQNLHLGFEVEVAGYMSKMVNITHKSHCVKEISTVAKSHQMEITGALEDAKEVVTKLTGAIEGNNRMIEQVEISKQTAFLAINQAFEILQQTLEERKRTLLSELEAISLSKTTALTLQKEQFEKMVGDIGHYTDMVSQILQTHTDHEIVAFGGLIPTELQATLKRVQTISLTPNQHSNIIVSVQTDDLVRQLSKSGEIIVFFSSPSSSTWTSTSVAKVGTRYHVKVQSKTSKGEEYPHGGVEVKGEMRSKTHNGAVVYGEVEDHRDGTYTITLTPQTAGPHQLLITMDGQHVQNSSNDLDVRPKRDYHTLCNAQQVIQCNRPRCVAIHDNGDIYVGSSDGCIYVFDPTGQLKNTIGSSGSGDGQFSSPSGISIKGDMLYVADTGNHRVQKLTSSGKFLHKFGHKGSGQGQFNLPRAVIIDSNNKLIVSDFNNHRIQIFNENGGWLLTIDGKGSGNHSFQSPFGLALDPQGTIHVAAYESNTIKVFTKEGVYVRMYGDLNDPFGIAIDDEGYSLVSEYSGNCLSIYDPEGNKIHTVGNLKNPRGTALDPRDGSVFIANCGANTVLKYCV
eukprot:Em0004g571a